MLVCQAKYVAKNGNSFERMAIQRNAGMNKRLSPLYSLTLLLSPCLLFFQKKKKKDL